MVGAMGCSKTPVTASFMVIRGLSLVARSVGRSAPSRHRGKVRCVRVLAH